MGFAGFPSFEDWIWSKRDALYWRFKARLKRRADAEDAVQQTFLKAYEYRSAIESADDPEHYFNTLANNVVKLLAKKRTKNTKLLENYMEEVDPLQAASSRETAPEDNVEANEASSRVEDALGELTDVQRQVMRLLREELSEDEIAAKLGITLSQVKNSKRLARMKLARKLKIDPDASKAGEGGDAPGP